MNKCVRGLGTTEGCPVGHVYLAVSEKVSVEERKRDSVHPLEEESWGGGTTPGKASQGLDLPGVLGKLTAIGKVTPALCSSHSNNKTPSRGTSCALLSCALVSLSLSGRIFSPNFISCVPNLCCVPQPHPSLIPQPSKVYLLCMRNVCVFKEYGAKCT